MPPERKLLPGKGGRSKLYAPPIGHPPANQSMAEDDLDDDDDDTESNDDVILPEVISEEDLANVNAKAELMKSCDEEGISLYHHLSELVTECLSDTVKTDQTFKDLVDLSRQIKRERVSSSILVPETRHNVCGETKAEWELFKTIGHEIPDVNPKRPDRPTTRGRTRERSMVADKEGNASRESNQTSATQAANELDGELLEEECKLKLLPDMMKQCHVFNMAGFGLPSSEYTRLALAMRELVLAYPLKSIRFWGKILGTRGNYFVVETKLTDEAYDDDDEEDEEGVDEEEEGNNNGDDEDFHSDTESELDPLPKSTYRPPPKIPKEESGTGVNAFVYFVCSQPGLPWRRLGDALPQHIVTARQVTSLFTGDLDHVHATYPPFPGDEACYLRAQIARITSSTCVSPIGYFKFDEDVEEEEEHTELTREACVVDEEFEGLSNRELADSGLTNWAHHVNYILPQGRTTWYNPYNSPRREQGGEGEDEYDEEEEEERMDADDMEPEMPQPLLIPISEDVDVGPSPPWIARQTSQFIPEHSPVAVTSARWPGAVTVATNKGRNWANLYIGWGLKALGENFDPSVPAEPVSEFPTGPEVIEQEDPTPEEEAAMKAVMREQEELTMEKEEEEEEEEEDEEDEEQEDY